MATPPRTWLITGASSGLGSSLALATLEAGYRVIGTSRDIKKAETECPEFSAKGGIWVEIDPGRKDSFDLFSECSQKYSVDVLVNNAGYALIGSVEDISEDEVRAQMDVNFYGPLRAVKACLPAMRAKGSGHIILISSGAGSIARPTRSSYSASKFAVEAIHESLSHEVRSLGIKTLIVEPGAFRTPFASRIMLPIRVKNGFSEGYKGTAVEEVMRACAWQGMDSFPDDFRGDPAKAATAIVGVVNDGNYEFLRLPLGTDCVGALDSKIGQLRRDLEATRGIAASTDID